MAERPYFYVTDNFVSKRNVEFEWFSGFAVSQKQKSIDSMHRAVKKAGFIPLEVSTKSLNPLGQKLSAFNLKLDGTFLECVFQSSKKFEKGGPFEDLLHVNPKEAKKDIRLQQSGRLVSFSYHGTEWALEPKTAFYDYIYYEAVRQCLSEEELKELSEFNAFTDIEFNPNKSLNTQARSAALVVYIFRQFDGLPEMSPERFLDIHKRIVKK